MTQANTSDLGQRLGPVDIPNPSAPTDPQQMAQSAVPTAVQEAAPAPASQPSTQPTPAGSTPATPAAAPQPAAPAFWTAQDASKANGMQPTFEGKLQQLVAMSKGRIWINSGYRNDALQVSLYKQAEKDHPQNPGDWVAKPVSMGGDGSNHTRGLAADLGGDLALAHQLAPQLGLTFPMSWEAWHIEPAGLRTGGAAPGSYSNPPPGQLNPVVDTTTPPAEALGVLSNHLSGADFSSSAASQDAAVVTGAKGLTAAAMAQGAANVMAGNFAGVPVVNATDTRSGSSSPTTTTAGATGGAGGATPTAANISAQAASPSQQAFISQVMPFAQAESKRTGIPAEVMIVQSGVETGWGTSGWWTNNRNPAGIGVTGAPGAGNSYPDLASAFRDYANKLMGQGEAGQEKFASDVKAGASIEQLLADLESAPWAAGHYGGNGLTNTYSALNQGGAFTQAAPAAAPSAPAPSAPAPAPPPSQPVLEPVTPRRNM